MKVAFSSLLPPLFFLVLKMGLSQAFWRTGYRRVELGIHLCLGQRGIFTLFAVIAM